MLGTLRGGSKGGTKKSQERFRNEGSDGVRDLDRSVGGIVGSNRRDTGRTTLGGAGVGVDTFLLLSIGHSRIITNFH